MANDTSKNGLWIDTRTNKVVDSEPVEGRLLVAPDGEITAAVQAVIDAAKAAAKPAPPEPREPETADAPQAVETATVPQRRKRIKS